MAMRTPRVRNRFACVGICAALGCAHAEQARPGEPATPGSVEHAASPSDAASAASCADQTGAAPPVAFHWPLDGEVTSLFGKRGEKPHRGIDISARYGTAVRAAAAGRVVFSDRKRNYGRVVVIAHSGGYRTVYAHTQDAYVGPGAHVQQGQVIAEVGATGNARGPHLHFEVRLANRAMDPLACLPMRAGK